MDSLKTVQPVEKSTKDIRKTVLTNAVKMLTERGLMQRNKLKENINKLVSIVDSEGISTSEYKVILSSGEEYHIKIIPLKITAIPRVSDISTFLNKYKKNAKMLIVDSIGKKAIQIIHQSQTNTEVFTEEELLINIVDHISVPKHIVLSESDTKKFYDEYNCKKRDMPRILTGDPVARYYNMKPNDICMILRPSEASGITAFYRLVVKGDLKK